MKNLNLSIAEGELAGFLGQNGAGKTTTIKMMCGLVEPTTGRITVTQSLTLVSVQRARPKLEDVFVMLTEDKEPPHGRLAPA